MKCKRKFNKKATNADQTCWRLTTNGYVALTGGIELELR